MTYAPATDAGLLTYRDLDEQVSLTEWAADQLIESRRGKDMQHSRYVIFQLAEVAVPRELLAAILARIQRLTAVPT